jgi:hypothetical protein
MRPIPVSLLAICSLFPMVGSAHHTYAEYDQQKTVEIEGTLLKAAWQNPHLSLKVQVSGKGGQVVTWNIEGASVNGLQRAGAKLDDFKVGEKVKAAGWPSKRAPDRMFLTNLLSARGQELVTWRYSQPRWTKIANGYSTSAKRFEGGTPSADTSVFRVWSVQLGVAGAAFDQSVTARADGASPLPLTAKARKAIATTQAQSSNLAGCAQKGMPSIMATPTPIELIDKGDTVVLRVEEYDTVRNIHMRGGNADAQPLSPLGYSTGRWDGKTLVVDTTRINWPWLSYGVPQSRAARLVERFTPSADGSRLDYALEATDPEMLTRPVVQKSSWVWRPGEKVMPFNCVADYQK